MTERGVGGDLSWHTQATCHAGFVFCSGLPAKAQSKERRKQSLKQEGRGEEELWARYLGESVSFSLAHGQGGCCQRGLHQHHPAVAGRLIAEYSRSWDSIFSHFGYQSSCGVYFSIYYPVRSMYYSPRPTEPSLEELSSPMTTVSNVTAVLLHWPDLTFNLR